MTGKKLKIVTVIGTRPEIIRLSRLMPMLDEYTDHVIVHTGQNYDYELNEIFFKDLGLRRPDRFMEVDTSSLGRVYGEVLVGSEKVFIEERPDAVVILGDTNSSIAGIIARRMKIPIYHLEAGNRCFDLNVPEETNRRIIDHISDFNLAYTEHARRNLLREGIHPRCIYVTGSPMREVLDSCMEGVGSSRILDELNLEQDGYFLVSLHREENVEYSAYLRVLFDAINDLCGDYGLPVVVSTHPRTRKSLDDEPGLSFDPLVRFLKPFGYLDYVRLQMKARCVISDSGTISEESAILEFPAVTPRISTERPESMDSGSIILTGIDKHAILRSVDIAIKERESLKHLELPKEYGVKDFSNRVMRIILGTAGLSHVWDGIVSNRS